MKTIAHRELRNNSSAVLREVQSGESIQITNHGTVVAVLHPPRSARAMPGRRTASIKGRFSEIVGIKLDHPIQDTLDELRGDR